jgi:DNA-binding response OmpR family regulator
MTHIRVLVAEDHDVARTLVAQTLQAIGFEVTAVADGDAALESALTCRPELMIVDVNMPQADGFEVLRRVKAEPQLRHIPVVMLTASGSSHDVARALDAGAADYLTKPFSPAELLARVRRLTRQIQTAAQMRMREAS